jgi:hypothetical protein
MGARSRVGIGADKLWAVHARTVSAIAAVSSLEATETGGSACAANRGGGKGYRGRGGQQRSKGGARSTGAPPARGAGPRLRQRGRRRGPKGAHLCRGSCFLSYTSENSHHLTAKIISKEVLC